MEFIRKLVKEAIEEALLSEAAVSFTDVINNPYIGLSITKTPGAAQLDLYDFSKNRVLGTIEVRHVVDNLFHVTGVAAEKGYGPLVYEAAMMTIYDNGLLPTRSGDIRGNAWEIWKKFYQRDDVGKFEIPETSRAYSDEFYEEDWEEDYVIGNTAFTMEPTREYNALIERTPILMRQKKRSQDDIRQSGGDYFGYKYADS